MDALSILDHVTAAWRVVGSVPMMVALVLLAAILAAVGGLVSWKMRVFSAMVGGMVVNALVKAQGAGYEAALAAMLVVTALGAALGSLGLIVRLMALKRR